MLRKYIIKAKDKLIKVPAIVLTGVIGIFWGAYKDFINKIFVCFFVRVKLVNMGIITIKYYT
jgi:hypothetical protein